MYQDAIKILSEALDDYWQTEVKHAWKIIKQMADYSNLCSDSELLAAVAVIDKQGICLGTDKELVVKQAWKQLKAELPAYIDVLEHQADVVRDFEARFGSIAFLKACISTQNKILVKANITTEDELKNQLEIEMLRYAEQTRADYVKKVLS